MCEVLDRIEEKGRAEGRAEGKAEGELAMLFKLVKKELLSLQDAVRQTNLSVDEFKEKMEAFQSAD